MENLEFKQVTNGELARTYHFSNGNVRFDNVLAVCVRPSGGHRLELVDGSKAIVSSGWLAITLEGVSAWSF